MPFMGSSAKLGRRTTGEEALRGADLSGKTAVVTGGSSGLGVETVRVLAGAGAKVVLACRSIESGQNVANILNSTGLKVRIFPAHATGHRGCIYIKYLFCFFTCDFCIGA
jgi:short chain dehydrogenase